MLDEVDREVLDWIAGLPGSPDVLLQAPEQERAQDGINLYLLDVSHAPPQRSTQGSTWQFHLRYLVTAGASDPRQAHRLLGQVLAAAVQREGYEVESEPPSLDLWLALGARPQPAFLLCVPWRHEAVLAKAPQVKHPVSLDQRVLAGLKGIVYGPGDTGIMAARVEIPALGLSTSTDSQGRFEFRGTPHGDELKLRVRAKGSVFESNSVAATGADGVVVIRLPV